MKIRNGFVSNSSSSSFYVAFDAVPKCVCELRQLLYGEVKSIAHQRWCDIHKECCDAVNISTWDLADQIWSDMQKEPCFVAPPDHKPIRKPKDKLKSLESLEVDDEWYSSEDEDGPSYAEFIRGMQPGQIAFMFNYGDNDGPLFGELEHGDTFQNLHHIRISQSRWIT